MPNYENETCEGCVHFDTTDSENVPYCWHHKKGCNVNFPVTAGWRCDDPDAFKANLKLRKMLALEGLTRGLECIADRMPPK